MRKSHIKSLLIILPLLLNGCGTDVKWLLRQDTEWNYENHTDEEMDARDKACNWIYVGIMDSPAYGDKLLQDIKLWLVDIIPYQPLKDCENIVTN